MKAKNYLFTSLIYLFLFSSGHAQQVEAADNLDNLWWYERVQPAPESVFKMFREVGMDPINHELTDSERENIQKSFSILPSSYQMVLREHLHSISFMDNMPNTALTSPLDTTLQEKKFNITFRAGVFNETISEWATWKENTCYVKPEKTEYEVRIEAGEMNAMVYILLHEATHIMDAVLAISPQEEEKDSSLKFMPFTRDIWYKRNVPVEAYTNPLLEKTIFRSGKPIPIAQAAKVYITLMTTPFVSLYGMASCNEDLAELATINHLTAKLNQPYRVRVTKHGKEMFCFEPMENDLVKRRLKKLDMFYETKTK